jgi:hypothetical protein
MKMQNNNIHSKPLIIKCSLIALSLGLLISCAVSPEKKASHEAGKIYADCLLNQAIDLRESKSNKS